MAVFSHPWLKTALRYSPDAGRQRNSPIPGLKQFGYPRHPTPLLGAIDGAPERRALPARF